MALPGVVGIGIGEQDGQPCLRVMVDAAATTPAAAVPPEIGGYAVVVDYTGPIRALEDE